MTTATASAEHLHQLPMQRREAQIVPASYNEADNTVDVVWTTGARGLRYDWDQGRYYEEELVVDDASVDMTRFDAGSVQALNSHSTYGLSSILGIATHGWLADGQGHARVKLSQDPSKAGLVADIKAGIIRNISVGYTVQRYEVIEPEDRTDGGQHPLVRATRWTPHEISFVTVPFDTGATTRAAEPVAQTYPCQITTRASAALNTKESPMGANTSSGAATAEPTAPNNDAILAAERQRSIEIITLCKDAGVPEQAADLIGRNLSVADAGLAILRAKAKTDNEAGGHVNVRTVSDETQTRLRGIEEVVASRLDSAAKLTDNGKRFRGMSLMEMGREHLEAHGVSTRGMDRHTLAGHILQMRSAPGYMGSSDFATLLSNVANKRLRQSYDAVSTTYRRWAAKAPNAPDFKAINIVQLDGQIDLQPLNEAGEFKYSAFTDSGTSYKLGTAGRIVALTRQAIINDDLRAFGSILKKFGNAAGRFENMTVYSLLTGNKVMGDNKALFHADHANNTTGGGSALSLDALRASRLQMRMQKEAGASDPLNLAPAYLIAPAALETQAYILTNANYVPAKQSDINEFAGNGRSAVEPIIEPLLDASSTTAWYLATDSAVYDTIEYCYLDGAEGPQIDQQVGFDVDGLQMRCRLDFAAGAVDWRGLTRATGA